MEIPAALASINAAISIAKALRDIDAKYDTATLKASIAELYSALAEAKMGLSDLKNELATKDKEIATLTAAFERKAELVEGADRLSYLPGEDGAPSGAPVCPKCLTADRRIVVTLKQGPHSVGCPVCATQLNPVVIYPLPAGTGHAALQAARSRGLQEAAEESQRNWQHRRMR